MSEFKESRDNPLFHKYGFVSNTGYILRKLKQYTPAALVCGSVDMVTGSVMSYLWMVLSKFVMDLLTSGQSEVERTRSLLIVLAAGAVLALVLRIAQLYAGSMVWPLYIQARMGLIHERVEKALTLDYELLEKPEMLDIHERATRASGSNNDGLEGMMHILQDLGKNLITVTVCFAAVLVLDWRLILALTVLTVGAFLIYRYTVNRDKKEVWDRLMPVWRRIGYMSRATQDFDYAKDIRLFSLSGFLLRKQRQIHESREEKLDLHHDLWNRSVLLSEGLSLLGKLLIYGVLLWAALRDRDKLTLGNFTMYLGFAVSFSGALTTLLQRFGDYLRESMKVDDFRSFLAQEGADPADPLPVPADGELTFEFHDVSYRYLKAEKDALSGLNLTLRPGEKLAVVGLNGAGKTTMIKLLLRLYDPTSGSITLNGTDIRRFRKADYYRLFSPVFQNVEIFAAPLIENIAMRPATDADREKAASCIEQAGLGGKLKEMKKGLDTELLKVVDEDGVDLSGGEKQKLALARALYKGAPVVVLDEPTAALDALAEKQLYERFNTMIGGHSAVYISHRLASTRFCDRIAMFADGCMTEYGTHDELMAKNGDYARMFGVQAQYYRENGEGADAE
ncbi:MAG: ABC transporter ATP-binding protein [Clostridia bacterium]|nr:ABC transporter ATP-binding protein [Clostridia bacterium]